MISDEEVQKLAELARLELNVADVPGLTRDLNSILDYVQQLERIDVAHVEPMSHVHGVTNVFREDCVEQVVDPEQIRELLPERVENFIRVPLIIETEE
jgi:aspartyl-tRNA(Asn)/glutamyl-tRNA(Gln) amidotransferase subunit C